LGIDRLGGRDLTFAVDDERMVRQKWRLLKATLDGCGPRLWGGAEADAIERGGVAKVARATKLAISTAREAETKFAAAQSARTSSMWLPLALPHRESRWPVG